MGIRAPHHRDVEQSRQHQVVSVQHLATDFQLTIDTGPSPALQRCLRIGKNRGHTHLLSALMGIRVFRQSRWSRLKLSYTRQHLFRKKLEGAQSALRIVSAYTLKGEVDHPGAYLIVTLLDLFHDRIWTADKIRWQGAIPKGWPRHPCNVAGIQLGEGVTHGRTHGERYLRLLLPPLQRLLGFRVAVGQENVATVDNVLWRRLPAVLHTLLS